MRNPSPQQLAEFYEPLGSQALRLKDGYTVAAEQVFNFNVDLVPPQGGWTVTQYRFLADLTPCHTIQTIAVGVVSETQAAPMPTMKVRLMVSLDGTTFSPVGEPPLQFKQGAVVIGPEFPLPPAFTVPCLVAVAVQGDGVTPLTATVAIVAR